MSKFMIGLICIIGICSYVSVILFSILFIWTSKTLFIQIDLSAAIIYFTLSKVDIPEIPNKNHD